MNNHNNSKIIGIVLCGGKSSRMNSDKGLLFDGNLRWFEKSYNLLSEVFEKVVISVNANQIKKYQEVNSELNYIIDSTEIFSGPLKGIMTAHSEMKECDLFVLACDMISMDNTIIKKMLANYNSNPEFDFYLFKNKGYLETLCGIYTSKGINKIIQSIDADKKRNFAIYKHIFANKPYILQTELFEEIYFSNYNSPEDILTTSSDKR